MIMFFCPSCLDFQYVKDLEKVLDELLDEPSKKLWSNLICSECGAIMATVKSDKASSFIMRIESDESDIEHEEKHG